MIIVAFASPPRSLVFTMTYFFRMEGIVQAQTPHGPHILGRERRKQEADNSSLVRDFVLAKDAACNDASLFGLGDIGLS